MVSRLVRRLPRSAGPVAATATPGVSSVTSSLYDTLRSDTSTARIRRCRTVELEAALCHVRPHAWALRPRSSSKESVRAQPHLTSPCVNDPLVSTPADMSFDRAASLSLERHEFVRLWAWLNRRKKHVAHLTNSQRRDGRGRLQLSPADPSPLRRERLTFQKQSSETSLTLSRRGDQARYDYVPSSASSSMRQQSSSIDAQVAQLGAVVLPKTRCNRHDNGVFCLGPRAAQWSSRFLRSVLATPHPIPPQTRAAQPSSTSAAHKESSGSAQGSDVSVEQPSSSQVFEFDSAVKKSRVARMFAHSTDSTVDVNFQARTEDLIVDPLQEAPLALDTPWAVRLRLRESYCVHEMKSLGSANKSPSGGALRQAHRTSNTGDPSRRGEQSELRPRRLPLCVDVTTVHKWTIPPSKLPTEPGSGLPRELRLTDLVRMSSPDSATTTYEVEVEVDSRETAAFFATPTRGLRPSSRRSVVDDAPTTAMPSTKRPRSPTGLQHAQSLRFHRIPASRAALRCAVPHDAISRVVNPDVAAFMANGRVVVRTHNDELCCVEEVQFVCYLTPLDAADIEYLEQFTYLVRLDLFLRGVNAAALAQLPKLTQLTHLNLGRCGGVDATGLAEVAKLGQLSHLDLSDCYGVDAAGLAQVAKLTQLTHLNLSSCHGVDATGLAEVAKLRQLNHLDLSYCRGVDAAGLSAVGQLTQLLHLSLSYCHGVDAAGLAEVGKLVQLNHLDLHGCGPDSVNAASLAAIAHLTQLERLDLSECRGINATALAEVGRLTQLEHLDLAGCDGVGAEGLAEVGKLTKLRYLDINECEGVDAAGLAALGKLTQLKYLDLSGCEQSTCGEVIC